LKIVLGCISHDKWVGFVGNVFYEIQKIEILYCAEYKKRKIAQWTIQNNLLMFNRLNNNKKNKKADQIEFGVGNTIPLWLFGLIY